MRRVRFDPGTLTGEDRAAWDAWAERAREALSASMTRVDEGNGADVDSASRVWQDAKPLLARLAYSFKCGYCEFDLRGGAFGPMDHYRPKGRIRELCDGGTLEIVRLADGSDHPGYWWLAYAWDNLVPACDRCNNHKGDQFPVAASRALRPANGTDLGALDALENPLLLHPMRDDPAADLRFDEFGGVTGITQRGATTVNVTRLDREELSEARRLRQQEARIAMLIAAGAAREPGERAAEAYCRLTAPDQRFSASVQAHLDDLIAHGDFALGDPKPYSPGP